MFFFYFIVATYPHCPIIINVTFYKTSAISWQEVKEICANLTSNEIFSMAIVGILTADVYTENML